jgi:integrase/recombinase XerD
LKTAEHRNASGAHPFGVSGEQNAVFCSHLLFPVNRIASIFLSLNATLRPMTTTLYDRNGNRKYLNARERLAFVRVAFKESPSISTFCLTMAFTGARISETLALTLSRVDVADEAVILETLKRRKKQIFRAVPVPRELIPLLTKYAADKNGRLWPWGRTTGWKVVKAVMCRAGISECLCKPKALRHAFAVEAGQKGVPLNIVQRWLGHARIETTAIYASAVGDEERELARKAWSSLELAISDRMDRNS